MSLKIDNEFKNLIPPLTKEEYQQLENNLVKEGCIDALVIWNGTLVDGHNRYEICTRHKIRFDTKEHQFANRDEVKEWIIRHQFGRRNLSPYQRSELALQLKPLIQAKAKENQKEHGGTAPGKTLSQNSDKVLKPKIDTTKEIAQIAGVSHDTIFKVEQIQKNATEDVKQKVKSGEMSIRQGYMSTRQKDEAQASGDAIKPKTEEAVVKKEQKENSGQQPELEIESIFNISYFQGVVNCFLKEMNPLSFSRILIKQMDEESKKEYLNQINIVHKWLVKIEENIKSNMEA
jgi:hypothetical protein